MASVNYLSRIFKSSGLKESLAKAGVSKEDMDIIRSNIGKISPKDLKGIGGYSGYMTHLNDVLSGTYKGSSGLTSGIVSAGNMGVFKNTGVYDKLYNRAAEADKITATVSQNAPEVFSNPANVSTKVGQQGPTSSLGGNTGGMSEATNTSVNSSSTRIGSQMRTNLNAMRADYSLMKRGIMSEETFNSRNAQFLTGDTDKLRSRLDRDYLRNQRREEIKAQRAANTQMTGNADTVGFNEEWAAKNGTDMSIGEMNIRQSNDYKQAIRTRDYQDNYYARKRAAQEQVNETSAAEARADVVPSQRPVGQGTSAADNAVNEAGRDAATQVPTAAGGGGLSFDNYSRDAQAAIIKEQGKSYWGRSAQERFHLDSMDRRYSEINKMKAGEERNAAIERFNQDLQSGPGFNDYMNGNQVYGKAAGVGVAALTASAVMGDGRRSNAQLYSSPF